MIARMGQSTVRDEIIEYYSEHYDENARLRDSADGRIEFLRTRELLRRHLPPSPARVLDVGGGSGVHAEWLAADGYGVHLIDPVARHCEQAAAVGTFTVASGDARDLEAEDGSYDVVLLLGPLYHLTERSDRIRALAEARRVVRPGGLVAAAAISRHAPVVDLAAAGRITADNELSLMDELATGHCDPATGFTIAYFHTVAELQDEVAEAGLRRAALYGVEGPAWPTVKHLHDAGLPVSPQLFDSALRAARLVETDHRMIAASSHLLVAALR
jgi:SAM-dependent methyltransferase